MRIYENGTYRDLTTEEIAAMDVSEESATEPTMEERLAALEAAMHEQILSQEGLA